MSWLNVNLNESLSSIKGQLTNLASNVLAETAGNEAPESDTNRMKELQQLVTDQETEIKRLQLENSDILKRINSNCNLESWSWDAAADVPLSQTSKSTLIASTCMEEMKQRVDDLERERNELVQSLEQLDQDCQQTTDKLVGIKDELQTENACLKLQHADFNKEIAYLNSSLRSLQLERQKKDEEFDQLVAELQNAKQNSAEAEHSANTLRKCKELETIVSDCNHQISMYEKELTELRRLQDDSTADGPEMRSPPLEFGFAKYYSLLHHEIAKVLKTPDCLPVLALPESGESIEVADSEFLEYQTLIQSVVKIISDLQWKSDNLMEEKDMALCEKQLMAAEKEHEIEKLKIASQEIGQRLQNKDLLIEELEEECCKLGQNNEMLIQRLDDSIKERQPLQTIPEASEEVEKSCKLIQQLERSEDIVNDLKHQLELRENELSQVTKAFDDCSLSNRQLDEEVHILRKYKNNADERLKEISENVEQQNMRLQTKHEEVELLNNEVKRLKSDNLKYCARQDELERLLKDARNEMKASQQKDSQMSDVKAEVDEMEANVRKLKTQVELLSKENEELIVSRSNYFANYKSFRGDVEKLMECYVAVRSSSATEIDKMKLLLNEKNEEFAALQKEIIDLQKQLASSQIESADIVSKNTALETQIVEINECRDELIALVKSKHQESINYHSEIQRMQQLLAIETEKSKTFQTQLAELNGLSFAHEDLVVKEKEIEKFQEQNGVLLEKCAKLAENLLEEQSKTQRMNAERSQASERELNLQRQLESLREHLLEVESMYTKEVQAAESKCSDMQMKLQAVVEQEKNSSNRFTSANIRANQQVETLQTNLQLVTNQRDEFKRKVSDLEDQLERQKAAMCNLQIVLEQFQRDKEKVIYEETQRVQRQVSAEKDIQLTMQHHINELKRQLEENKAGLKAAVRLSDQVEVSKQQVATMKDEVMLLQKQLAKSEEKYKKAINQADGRVDRLLVKNLVIGLIACNNRLNKDQNQILKIISTVLDFNQQDIEKVNLHRKDEGNWFSSQMPPNAVTGQNISSESLTQAFVKFLEAESKPRNLPNLLETATLDESSRAAQSGQHNSGETSTSSSRKTSVRQSPIILNEVVLPTFADFAANRNSSAILKNVLKDNTNTS